MKSIYAFICVLLLSFNCCAQNVSHPFLENASDGGTIWNAPKKLENTLDASQGTSVLVSLESATYSFGLQALAVATIGFASTYSSTWNVAYFSWNSALHYFLRDVTGYALYASCALLGGNAVLRYFNKMKKD